MSFNIANFRTIIEDKGLLRPNKFKVNLFIPTGFYGIAEFQEFQVANRMIEFYCDIAAFPGVMLATHDARRYSYGPNEKRPFSAAFSEFQMSFYSDGDAKIWNLFQSWINMIYNFDNRQTINVQTGEVNTSSLSNNSVKSFEPYELSYRDEYVTEVKITIYDQEGIERKIVVLRDAFPLALSDLPLNWSDNNSLLKIPVTFAYTDWYRINPEDQENI